MSPHKVSLSPFFASGDGCVVILPDKDNSGIEVTLSLVEEHMEKLLQNEEFKIWFDVM